MRVSPIAEVLGMQAGTPIEAVAGVVVAITEYKTGQNRYGDWSIQNVTITDGQARLKVKVVNHQEVTKEWMNHRLFFIAGVGKKAGGTVGLKVELDTYKNVTSTIVSCTEAGSLCGTEPEGSGQQYLPAPPAAAPSPAAAPARAPGAPTQPPRPPTQAAPPPPAPSGATPDPLGDNPEPTQAPPDLNPPPRMASPPARNPGAGLTPRKAWASVDKQLLRLIRMRERSLSAALALKVRMEKAGYTMAADHVEKVDSWLAIELCRNGALADVPDCDPPTSLCHPSDGGEA